MRRLQGLVTLAVVAAGCNEVLGLDAGRRAADETGGSSGSAGSAGSLGVGGTAASGAGGSPMRGGSSSVTGGEGGGNGEAGTSEGGTGGTRGGRGGSGGSSSGDGGDNGETGGAGAGGHGPCSSSLACRADGYEFCIHGECARITAGACDTIIGDEWVDQDPEAEPYIFGALARRDLGVEMWNLKLAMREFSEHGRILIEGEERRPVLLTCFGEVPDFQNGMDWLEPLRVGYDHLIDDLGVSSVLLLLKSRPDVHALVARALSPLQRDDDVFFLDVGGATQSLLSFEDIADWEVYTPRRHGRLWHMRGDAYSLALPIVPLVERIEELVNPGASTGESAQPTRLVVVTGTTNEFDREIIGVLLDDWSLTPIRINGMPLEYQPGQGHVVASSGAAMGNDVAEFEPHIVLDFSGDNALGGLVDEAFRVRDLPRPFYIVPPESARSAELLDRISGISTRGIRADPSLRTRIVGLFFASAEDPTLKQEYLERLRTFVQSEPEIPNLDCCENAYDAVYFLIYGAAAGGQGGTAKAMGFHRLLDGPERHIGPDGIQAVLARLASSPDATLRLTGPSGDFPFHPPTGGRIAFGNAWCVDKNLQVVMDALRYDRVSNDFTGTLSCLDP